MKKQPSFERAHQLLSYNHDSGLFYWKESRGGRGGKAVKGAVAGCIGTQERGEYVYIGIDGGNYYAHRIAWLMHYGELPNNQIDHINRIKTDNRISNLREVTNTQNQRNISMQKNCTSGVTGVRKRNGTNKWIARIEVNKKIIWLGTFDEIQDAANARSSALVKYGFSENHGF